MGMPAFDIEVDGPELPILDGSAAPVHAALCRAGLRPRFAFVELDQEIEVRAQGGEARLRPVSSEQIPRLTAQVELGPCAPRMESVCFRPTVDDFGLDIAPARTFCHLSEVESLRAQGLIRGGSLDCALVLSEDGPIPGQSYRLPQEPTRHKILDAIGDLSLLGGLPWAEIELFRPGHALIHEVVRQAAPHVRKTQRFADALKTDLG
jgi:UDP-3-O-[3-hydroxymyristoyl] N-acetylglucosamine deacetylase